MARRPNPPQPRSAQLSVAEMQAAVAKIERRLADLKAFDAFQLNTRSDSAFTGLKTKLEDTLSQIFPPDTYEYSQYSNAFHLYDGPYNYAYEVTKDRWATAINESRDELIGRLGAMIEMLRERISDAVPIAPERAPVISKATQQKVFIVHGHDDGLKITVARLVERLGLTAVILHEQPNKGATLIEKLEANAGCDFAIVLLTPDDLGKAKTEVDLKPRARQNVVLELGYFSAKLGRSAVCALYSPGVEIPSDFDGVAYVAVDPAGAWKYQLGHELDAAGFVIDMNKLKGI